MSRTPDTFVAIVTKGSMLPGRDDRVTKSDLTEMGNLLRDELRGEIAQFRDELKGEMSEVRTEVAILRSEMEHRYATRADVQAMSDRFTEVMAGHVRLFGLLSLP